MYHYEEYSGMHSAVYMNVGASSTALYMSTLSTNRTRGRSTSGPTRWRAGTWCASAEYVMVRAVGRYYVDGCTPHSTVTSTTGVRIRGAVRASAYDTLHP